MAKAQAPGQAGNVQPAAGTELVRKAQRQAKWDPIPWDLLIYCEDSGLSLDNFKESLWLLDAQPVGGWATEEEVEQQGSLCGHLGERRQDDRTHSVCIRICGCVYVYIHL